MIFSYMNSFSKISFLKLLITTHVILLMYSCNQVKDVVIEKADKDYQQWVFIVMEIPSYTDTINYYYYGQVKSDLLDEMEQNDTEGFFLLRNIRFINKDDKLDVYEDKIELGTVLYRKRDIVKISVVKTDPILTMKPDELTEAARQLLIRKK